VTWRGRTTKVRPRESNRPAASRAGLSKDIAKPIGAICSGALMLEHLGEEGAAEFIIRAIEKNVADGILPVDSGGTARTAEIGARVAKSVQTL